MKRCTSAIVIICPGRTLQASALLGIHQRFTILLFRWFQNVMSRGGGGRRVVEGWGDDADDDDIDYGSLLLQDLPDDGYIMDEPQRRCGAVQIAQSSCVGLVQL